jgi:hypothetical protein
VSACSCPATSSSCSNVAARVGTERRGDTHLLFAKLSCQRSLADLDVGALCHGGVRGERSLKRHSTTYGVIPVVIKARRFRNSGISLEVATRRWSSRKSVSAGETGPDLP